MIVFNDEEIEDKTHFIRWETSYKINGIFQNNKIMKDNLELFQIERDWRAMTAVVHTWNWKGS